MTTLDQQDCLPRPPPRRSQNSCLTIVAVFICGLTADLQVSEEFLQLILLCCTTTEHIYMLQCVEQHSLDLYRLVCVMSIGAGAMTGKKTATSLLVHHCEAAILTQLIHKKYCIINQEARCAICQPH